MFDPGPHGASRIQGAPLGEQVDAIVILDGTERVPSQPPMSSANADEVAAPNVALQRYSDLVKALEKL